MSDPDMLAPLAPRDMKVMEGFDGPRKEFMSWHESFTSMLYCRSSGWRAIVSFLKARKEERIKNANIVKQGMVAVGKEKVAIQIEEYKTQLYRHLQDHVKDPL